MALSFVEGSEMVLKYPCYGLMNIKQIAKYMLDSKYTPIKVINISPSRMGFISYLSLPINENVIWSFTFMFPNEVLSLCGVLRKRSLQAKGYIYFIEWIGADQSTGAILLQKLSNLEYQLKYEFEKAVRGYLHTMELVKKVSIDITC